MKPFLIALSIVLVAVSAQAGDVGVSVSVAQPGFYGRIDVGNFPRPEVVYPRPVVVQPAPVGVVYEPIYVYAPPGHQKHWSKHCHEYNACGRPVYFVRERWYKEVYVPQYYAHDRHQEQKHHKGHH